MDLGMGRLLKSIPNMRPHQVQLSPEAKKDLHDAFHEFTQAANKIGSAVENVILENLEAPSPKKVEGNGKGEHHEKTDSDTQHS